jgi:cytochrome P450
MGSELYRTEPVFRDSVETCCAAAAQAEHAAETEASFSQPESLRELSLPGAHLAVLVCEIALTDLFRTRGVVPDATLGISSGEIAAAYASGALSREDSVRIALAWERTYDQRVRRPRMMFSVSASSADAKNLARTAPVPLTFLGSVSLQSTMLLAAADDAGAVRRHLQPEAPIQSEHPTNFAYHTPLTVPQRQMLMADTRGIAPRPGRIPFFACSAGHDVGETLLGAEFWYWMGSRPYYLAEATSCALEWGCDTAVMLGARPGMQPWLAATATGLGRELRFVTSMRETGSELGTWRTAMSQLRSRARRQKLAEATGRLRAKRRPSAHAPVPTIGDYDGVRAALDSPDRFSSRAWSEFDESILSLDPPEHDAPRQALRRLLEPREVERLSTFADELAYELLQPLTAASEFDVLGQFATPLSERTLGLAFGLQEEALEQFAEVARGRGYEANLPLAEDAIDSLPEPPPLLAELADRSDIGPLAARRLVRLLWVAGTLAPRRLIGFTVLALGASPSLRERVLAEPDLVGPLVDEALRLNPPQPLLRRTETRDGSRVFLSLAQANRDPSRFPAPDAVDLDRPARHLSFGSGVHRCPGARLGRAQAVAGISALLQAMPAFEVLQPAAALRHSATGEPQLDELIIAPGAVPSRSPVSPAAH